MANGTNVGNVELKVTLNKEHITQELLKTFENCQSQAEKNTITYKIAGDKASLDAMLKQIQGLKPELSANLRLDFDKTDYDKEMAALKNTTGKTAKQIGDEFKATIGSSLKDFNVSQVIGKKIGKNDLLNVKDISKIKDVLQSLMQQTEGFDLSKVTSVKAINDQVVALNKMKVLLDALSNHTEQKSIKIDEKTFNIAQMLQQNTSSIDNIMQQAGSVIHSNAQKWMTDLENTFNTEYGSIISMLENLGKGVQGVLGGSGSNSSGNGTSKELEELEKQITNVTQKIQEAEAELEKLKSKKNSNTESPVKIEDIGESVKKLSGNLMDSKYDKEAKNLLTLVEAWKSAGNSITELERKFPNFSARLKEVTEAGYKANKPKTQVIDTKAIENQQKIVDNLKSSLESLMAKKKELEIQTSVNSSGTGTGSGNGTPTTATVSPHLSEDFKTKLQEQVTNIGTVDVSINGKLSETFKDDVQNNVNSLGSIDMGVSFSNQKKEGETKQEIPVDVIATPKLSDTFKDDLQKKVDDLGSYEVKVNLKDANKENNSEDEPTLINVKPNNIEDFKSQLKSGVEGDNGLDIKVNPIIPEDFNLEIKNATLKDVKVEGDINGGNLKPTTVEAPVVAPPVVDGTDQDDVDAKLDETKKKQEEVGNAAVESGEKQRRSLLEVRKEWERVNAEQSILMQAEDSLVSPKEAKEAKEFIATKEERAKQYQNIQELVTKIQSEMTRGTKDSDFKHAAKVVAYVERLKELAGNAFNYNVLGENGEEVFNSLKTTVDKATNSVAGNNAKIRELCNELTRLKTEEASVEKIATDAEKLELQMYEAAKSFKSNGSAINTTTGKFKDFLELWKQYKAADGTGKLSEFTDNAKLISAVTKEYNAYIETVKVAQEAEKKALQSQVDTIKDSLSKKFPNVDLTQYTVVFDEVLNKKKSYTDAFAEIRDSILAMQSAANGGSTNGTTPLPQSPQTPTPLGINGEINVVPKVEDPAGFANNVTEQLKGVSAEIDVKPKMVEQPVHTLESTIAKLREVQQELETKAVGKTGMSIDEIAEKIKQLQRIISKTSPSVRVRDFDFEYSAFNSDLKSAMAQMPNTKKEIEVYIKQLMSGAQFLTTEMTALLSYVGDFGSYNDSDVFKTQKDKSKAKYIYDVYQKMIESIKQDEDAYKQASHELYNLLHLTDDRITSGTDISSKFKKTDKVEDIKNKLLTGGIDGRNIYKPNQTAIQMFDNGYIANIDDVINKIHQLESVLQTLNIQYTECKAKSDQAYLNGDDNWYEQANAVKTLEKEIKNYGQQLYALQNLQRNHESFINSNTNVSQGSTLQGIQIPLDANIESLNASIQSKKDQILPVDVKLNGILSSTSTDTNVGTTGMAYETEQAELLRQKITEITTAVDAKTNAFRQEEQVVNGTVQNEISMLEALDGQLYIILQTIQKIQALPITLNVKVSDDFYNSESKVNSVIDELKTSLSGIDSAMLQNLTSILQALNIKDSTAKNVQNLANAVLNLKSNLNNLSVGGNQFLNDIKELANSASGLKELVTVIKTSKEELQKAKGKIAEGATKESNPKDAAKQRGAVATVSNKDFSKDEIEDREIKITGKTEELKQTIEEANGIVKSITSFYDSEDNLIKTQIKAQERIDGALRNTTYTTGYSRAKKDQEGVVIKEAEAFASSISSDEYEKGIDEQVKSYYSQIIDKLKQINQLKKDLPNMGSNEAEVAKSQIKRLQEQVRYRKQILSTYDASILEKYKQKEEEILRLTGKDQSGKYSDERSNAAEWDKIAKQQAEEYQNRENEYLKERNRLLAEGKKQEEEYSKQQYSENLAQAYAEAEKNIQAENEYIKERNRLLTEGKKQEEEYYKNKASSTSVFSKKDQTELYNSLSKAVQRYVYWLKEEEKAIGSAKSMASELRKDAESIMNSLRTDIKSYGLQNLEKELDLDRQILEAKLKINHQDEIAAAKMAESSYDRELKLEEKKNRLQINNIGVDSKTVAKNNVRIAEIDRLIKKEQDYRETMGLSNKSQEAAARLINMRTSLTQNLKVEQDAYNQSIEQGNKDAHIKLQQTTNNLKAQLEKAISNYSGAEQSQLLEAQSMLNKFNSPVTEFDVDSSNVNSIIKKITIETNKIINVLKTQHEKVKAQKEKLEKETLYSGMTKEYESMLNSLFTNAGITYEGAVFKEASVDTSGKTIIKFLELVNDKAREVTVTLKDANSIVDQMQNGEFDINSHSAKKSNWRNATKAEKGDVNNIAGITSAYTKLINSEEEYQKLLIKRDNNTATSGQIDELNKLAEERARAQEIINKIPQGYKLSDNELAKQKEYASIQDRVNNKKQGFIEKETTIQSLLEKTNTLMSQFGNSNIQGFDQVLERAKTQVAELNNKLKSDSITNFQTGYEDKINKIVSSLKNIVAVSLPGDIKTANEEMLRYASTLNNGNINIGNFTSNNRVLTASFETQKGVIKEVALVYDELSGSISLVEKGTKRVNTFLESFSKGLKQRFASLAQYLMTFVSFYRIWGIIKQGVTYIKEFDTALTEMRKVSDESVSSLKNFQKVSFDIANSVGTTAVQIQNSTADWMRLGESIEEAAESARVSNILLNVSEFEDINSATDSLIAMSAAYSELEKQDIVDKLNEVGKILAQTYSNVWRYKNLSR